MGSKKPVTSQVGLTFVDGAAKAKWIACEASRARKLVYVAPALEHLLRLRKWHTACPERPDPPVLSRAGVIMLSSEAPRLQFPQFRLKKRARVQQQRESGFDFTLENPADGRFKDLDCVKRLLAEFPDRVFNVVTSYCHYGYPYRKRTLFIGTLPTFQPVQACPITVCPWLQSAESRDGSKKHPKQVVATARAQKNSLPPKLIDLLIESWKSYRVANKYLLIDVFSGWGSIEDRVRENQSDGKWLNVFVYSNDIVNREHTQCNLDMRQWTPDSLLVFAVNRFWPEKMEESSSHPGGVASWLLASDVTVLMHCSTPCETYSINGLCVHREKQSVKPKSEAARAADRMNEDLVSYFRARALSTLSECV